MDRRRGDIAWHWLGTRLRRRRAAVLVDSIGRLGAELGRPVEVLDVGGVEDFWLQVGLPPGCRLTILNLPEAFSVSWWFFGQLEFERLEGTVMDLSSVRGRFDLVVCNSLIEHLGCWDDMARGAQELRRAAPHGWVQTPAFGFPFEPHHVLPVVHWFAPAIQARLLVHAPRFRAPRDRQPDTLRHRVEENNLLTRREFEYLFPDAHHHREHFLGLTKSFIAAW